MPFPRRVAAAPFLAAFFFLSLRSPARAYGEPFALAKKSSPSDRLKFSAKPWFTSGTSMFQIYFPLLTGVPKSEVAGGSTLKFNDSSHLMTLLSAEVRALNWLSFDFEYGYGGFSGGTSDDHDWIHAPRYNITLLPSGYFYPMPNHADFSLSRSALSGSASFKAFNAFVKIYADDGDVPSRLDASLGYAWYDERFRMRDGVQLFSDGVLQTQPLGPFSGLDSRFNFHWEGAMIGLREEIVLPARFSAVGRLGYAPSMEYTGEGYWNLRPDLRQGAPNFVHRAGGHAVNFELGLGYSPWPSVTAECGYMWHQFTSGRGTDTTYFADGSSGEVELERAGSERKGVYLGVSLRY